jgi:hypothetical protein
MPIALPLKIWCGQMGPTYEQMGVELLESSCDLEINQLEAARLISRSTMGKSSIKQYQYFYMSGKSLWILTLTMNETEWDNYVSTFETIGESFTLPGEAGDQS